MRKAPTSTPITRRRLLGTATAAAAGATLAGSLLDLSLIHI